MTDGMFQRALHYAGLIPVLFCFVVPVVADDNASPELIIKEAPAELADNIRAYLQLGTETCELSPLRQRALTGKLDKSIQNAAQAVGYYHLHYTSELNANEHCWSLTLNIDPGEPVSLDRIDVQVTGDGAKDNFFQNYLRDELPVKRGDRLNHGRYEKIKTDLSRIAEAHGYLKASFTASELRVDTSTNHAAIILHYDTGPRMVFGKVRFPETILSSDVLHRYLPFQEGDPYNIEQLNELQRALDDTRYFSRVGIQPELEQIDQQERVPVDIELVPNKQHAYQFGVGAATDTGPRIKFGYKNRYLNDRGHSLNYDLSLSPVRSETQLDYIMPLHRPASQHLNIYTGYLTENTDTSEQDTYTLGLGYTRINKPDWLQTVFLNFQREKFRVGDTEETTDLLIPGISWSKVKADDPLYPLHGWRLQARLRAASDKLGSDVTFYQASIAAKTVFKAGPGRFLLRLDTGKTETDNFDNLPASVRFFAGGDNSVRGYNYQSLGPVDENGDVVGGANLLVGSVEYDIRFARRWAIAAFYDIGNAFNENNKDYKRGAGLGVRWISPIGPIRIDFARALDNDHAFQLHLSMGPDL